MSTRINCPGCGRSLSLPSDCTAETLSCPRCLARIPNPQAPAASTGVQVEALAVPASAAQSTGVTQRGEWTRDVDVDVRRDSRGMSGCLIALAVLGGLGVSGFVLGGVAGGSGALPIVLGVLLVFTLISAAWVYSHPRPGTGRSNLGRTVLGVLVISGVLVALWAAAMIFLFVVCLVNPPHFGR